MISLSQETTEPLAVNRRSSERSDAVKRSEQPEPDAA